LRAGQHNGGYGRQAANPMNDAKDMNGARDRKIIDHQYEPISGALLRARTHKIAIGDSDLINVRFDSGRTFPEVREVPIVLQKSPNKLCEIKICNNRIGAPVPLRRCCAFVPDLESMFRDEMLEILLQQYLPEADSCTAQMHSSRCLFNETFGPVFVQGEAHARPPDLVGTQLRTPG
jgi:hypothetical protein